VHDHVSQRVPLGTELYVIGCAYVGLGVAVAYERRAGYPVDETALAVQLAIRRFLWPLPPGGASTTGWPRGRSVRARELEVAVARVPGVDEVVGVSLFLRDDKGFQRVTSRTEGSVQVTLDAWELPELLRVVVVEGTEVPEHLDDVPDDDSGVPIPVVPELC
jgi:hypothetical protein